VTDEQWQQAYKEAVKQTKHDQEIVVKAEMYVLAQAPRSPAY
jgi:hypothetical protein